MIGHAEESSLLHPTSGERILRVLALGASNLTRGFQALVSAARTSWGPEVEIWAALGHGRSYGVGSRVLARTLPGILSSGLWEQLELAPPLLTRGLITDVGNDILYGFSAEQILQWVEEAVNRMQRFTPDILLAGLPLAGIRGLSRSRFLVVRPVLFPSCRQSLHELVETAERVEAGLAELASGRSLRFFPLKPEWYGFDPIHIRSSMRGAAWRAILGVSAPARRSFIEQIRLSLIPPERRWLFGVEQHRPQVGRRLPSGGRVWLY